jgi:hypothetical protein
MFYWFLFFIPVRFFYLYRRSGKIITNKIWKIISIFLTLIIGLRENVGGDWIPYKEGLERISSGNFEEVIFEKYEIGFNYLSWISVNLGLGVYGVNFICAAIFVHGLIKLSKEQPYPWLALVASVPYLIIVVAMGYTRQATAIGLLMFGFGYLIKGRSIIYLLLVILATSFHKPAFLFVSFIF